MAKIFYDHLILIEEISTELEQYSLSADEKEELLRLADEALHHHVLETILTHLPEEKHEKFLTAFHKTPYDRKLLDYLKKEIEEDIEEKIRAEAAKVKKEILAEIRRAKKE